MRIEDQEVSNEENYLDRVTYVPVHVKGNAGHSDCEQGVIISVDEYGAMVLYCKSRSVQKTNFSDLVWG